MQNLIGIRLGQVCKIFYFKSGGIEVSRGDRVVVETGHGLEMGTVVIPSQEFEDERLPSPLNSIIRIATPEDFSQLEENRDLALKALPIGAEAIARHELKMRLVKVEYAFDRSRIIFYFSADGRVDFRALVRDLARIFRTRIELRQIGVRDEAKMVGGLGGCGRPLCCATFLSDFATVSIKMAKNQNISLNPAKISGICGRLMCCLKYEDYPGASKTSEKIEPPAIGSRVETSEGRGKVITTNGYRRTATILLDSSVTIISAWEELKIVEGEVEEVKEIKEIREIRDQKEVKKIERVERVRVESDEKSKPRRRPPRKPLNRNPKVESKSQAESRSESKTESKSESPKEK